MGVQDALEVVKRQKETAMDVKAKLQEIRNIRKSVTEELQQNFAPMAKAELFDKYPELQSFSWTQYTPYFNDGDVCEFGVNFAYGLKSLIIGGKQYGDDDGEDENGNEIPHAEYGSEDWKSKKPIEQAVIDFLKQIDEEFYKDLFGDHAVVTVKADGVTTEEYEHD